MCTSPDEQSILLGLREGVVPRGAADAGTFTRDDTAQSMAECVASCCASESCEVSNNVHENKPAFEACTVGFI